MLNEITKQWLHDTTYINFKKATHAESKVLHKKEFYAQVEELHNNNMKQIEHTTVRNKYQKGSFAITEKGSHLRLTWRDSKGYHQRYTNFKDDAKNEPRTGSVIGQVKKKFKKRTSMSMGEAFGSVSQAYKKCVIGLFHYDNLIFDKKTKKVKPITKNFVYKYDFTSHFPACSKGTLPDANTAIYIDHEVEPTADYPFAFYIDSGFIAEYGKYNTKDFYNTKYRKSLFESEERVWKINPNCNSRTVLMKASTQILEPEMTEYYNIKATAEKGSKERDEAKVVLLKIIGQMEQNDKKSYYNNPYAHLAAVIKARAVLKMLELINKIGEENIIEIIVDGVICQNILGKHFEDKTEFLGSLKCETSNAVGKFIGHNQYVLAKPDGTYDITHAGYDLNIGPDITQWDKSPVMALRDSIKALGISIENMNEEMVV